MDRLQTLRVFVRVAEHGGFARAGVVLNMSNAVVSRHVADLERHLGARLINRTTRRLSLTDTGKAYLEKARQILEAFDEAGALAGADTTQARGTLKLFAPSSFGPELNRILPEYLRSQSGIRLDVTVSDHEVDIVRDGYDVGIFTNFQPFDASMVVRQLGVSEVVVCASPDYVRRHGAPRTPEELAQHVCLNFSHKELRHAWIFAQGGKERYRIPVGSRVVSNSGDLLRACALDGAGLLLRTSFTLNGDLESGRLVRLLPDHFLGELDVVMAYPSRRQVPARLRTFIDFMIGKFPDPREDGWRPRPRAERPAAALHD